MEKREGFFGRFFGISQSGSNMRTEILAGITTFITVAYILILNPQILACLLYTSIFIIFPAFRVVVKPLVIGPFSF